MLLPHHHRTNQRTHAAAEVVAAVRVTQINMKKNLRSLLAVIVVIAAIGYIGAQQTSHDDAVISAQETRAKLHNDTTIFVLDVRTPEEHIGERIANTMLIPVQELEQRIHELDAYKDRTIIVYCRSGNRSGVATAMLRKKGFNAVNMQGGIIRWKSKNFPTISGPMQ